MGQQKIESVLFDGILHSHITDSFDLVNLACVPLKRRNRTSISENFDFLKEVLRVRGLEEEMCSADSVRLAIEASGGHLRQLLRIWRRILEKTSLDERVRVSADDIKRALATERTSFKRILQSDDYAALRAVHRYKALSPEQGTRLLQMLAAFEYIDLTGEGWFDVNPIVRRLVLSKRPGHGSKGL